MYSTHEIPLNEHLAWWSRIKESDRHRYFMYEHQNQPLGIVAFVDIDPDNLNSSWAFYAAPCAPKGIGSRMEALALDYAFNELSLHKLYCEVLAFNEAVINLHQKFAFKIEGTLRDQYRRDGQYIDIYRLGLLSKEWAAVRDQMHARISQFSKV